MSAHPFIPLEGTGFMRNHTTRGASSSSVSLWAGSASEEAAEQQEEQMWATAAVLMAAPTSVLFVASLTSSWILVSASADMRTITAGYGDTVTLPCQAPAGTNITAVKWTRPDLDTFLWYRRLFWFDPDNQHPSFKERVELKDSQMQDGDVSVTLKDATFNDTGTYECHVDRTPGGIWMITIHLNVTQLQPIVLCIVVSSPYVISTVLMVSLYRQQPTGRKMPVTMTMPRPPGEPGEGLDPDYDDVTTEHQF